VPQNASTLFIADTARLWEAMRQHPVVRGIAAGTLPREQFDFFIQQQFHAVVGARRFLCLLMARTAEQDTVQRLGEEMLTLGEELERFQRYARERTIRLTVDRAPTCEAYVNFLINHAVTSFEHGLTVLFATKRASLDVWRSTRPASTPRNPYQPWIDFWTTPAHAAQAGWIEACLNRAVEGWSEVALAPLRRCFQLAGRYEYLMWDMVARQEKWPL
jgi:thiaminase/transcriptional activator TenA